MENFTINVDFDGTVVTHDFPNVGKDIGSVPVLKKMVTNGCKLILFTMRSGETLGDAVKWFKDNDIPLYGVQTNPTQRFWTTSPKSYANLMIDDSAIGCPLKFDEVLSERPFVDWVIVEKMLLERGVIK